MSQEPSLTHEPICKTHSIYIIFTRGEGTLSVPESERRIGPLCLRDGPLLIGRKYQTDLHKRVVSPDCLQFVSREHFQISFAGGGFRLKALTSNPIWRDVGDGDSVEACLVCTFEQSANNGVILSCVIQYLARESLVVSYLCPLRVQSPLRVQNRVVAVVVDASVVACRQAV